MAKTLKFHEPQGGMNSSAAKYLMVSEIHRVDSLPSSWPPREDGARAVIVCKGADALRYRTVESAEELVAQIEASS